MSILDRTEVWREFSANPPADQQAIEEFEAQVRIQLPHDYVSFLRKMNGGEGNFGEAYLSMWNIDWSVKCHKFNVAEDNWPGFLAFGSDGGGEQFGFDLRADAKEIVAFPYVSTGWEDSIRVAPTFTTFLEVMYKFGPGALFKSKLSW